MPVSFSENTSFPTSKTEMNTYISFVPKRLESCLIEGLLVSWVFPAQEL